MAKKRSLEDDIASAFDHWSISDKAKAEASENFRATKPSPDQKGVAVSNSKKKEQGTNSFRPSTSDTQKLRDNKRVFPSRPIPSEHVEPIVLKNLSEGGFRLAYQKLHDVVLPQVEKRSRLLLCILFRHSFGENRNWCKMSFPDMRSLTNMTNNTLRASLKPLLEKGWVLIASEGYHEATTYVINLHQTDNEIRTP